MTWPHSQDYNEVIQNPRHNLSDPELREGTVVTNALGLPVPRSGNFADVYEFLCPASQGRYAVKCFTREVPGLRERYSEISRHLEAVRLPFTVDFSTRPRASASEVAGIPFSRCSGSKVFYSTSSSAPPWTSRSYWMGWCKSGRAWHGGCARPRWPTAICSTAMSC